MFLLDFSFNTIVTITTRCKQRSLGPWTMKGYAKKADKHKHFFLWSF